MAAEAGPTPGEGVAEAIGDAMTDYLAHLRVERGLSPNTLAA